MPRGGRPSGLPTQGLPSFTKTGTATRRGELSPPTLNSWAPFSCTARFVLYLWFWNQIFTWVGVRRIRLARCSRSGAERYLCWRNLRSNSYVCAFENKTRRFRFLCAKLGSEGMFDCWSWSWSSSCSSWSSWSSSWSGSCLGSGIGGELAEGPTYESSDALDVLSGLACWPTIPTTKGNRN